MRHRQRKDDYVKVLETQMTGLQRSIASATMEKDSLARENAAMAKLLNQTLTEQPTSRPHEHSDLPKVLFTKPPHQGDAILSLKHYPDVDGSRLTVTPVPCKSTYVECEFDATVTKPTGDIVGDTWNAIDFVLALEWPCRGHVSIPSHIATQPNHHFSSDNGPDCHAMTMTSTIYARTAVLPNRQAEQEWNDGNTSAYGYVPYLELGR